MYAPIRPNPILLYVLVTGELARVIAWFIKNGCANVKPMRTSRGIMARQSCHWCMLKKVLNRAPLFI